jgi:phage recombination protein Bet
MTNAIAAQSKQPLYSQEQIDLIKSTVAKGATNDEFKLFMVVAARSGLDPFTKQIHFVKRGDLGTIQTGIDGYRAIAERTKTLAGIDDAIYNTESEPHPNKATVTVYRLIDGQRIAFTASARWSEYVPQAGQDFMWKKMPYLMLGKVAEALALRKAFPNDLSGLYTHEEMAQAGDTGIPQNNTPARATAIPASPDSPLCPEHNKPMRQNARGWYCATKLQDGSWCKAQPVLAQPAEELPTIQVEQADKEFQEIANNIEY